VTSTGRYGQWKSREKNFAITQDSVSAAVQSEINKGIKWIGLVRSKKFALPLGHK